MAATARSAAAMTAARRAAPPFSLSLGCASALERVRVVGVGGEGWWGRVEVGTQLCQMRSMESLSSPFQQLQQQGKVVGVRSQQLLKSGSGFGTFRTHRVLRCKKIERDNPACACH
jgi:hypothetical protein